MIFQVKRIYRTIDDSLATIYDIFYYKDDKKEKSYINGAVYDKDTNKWNPVQWDIYGKIYTMTNSKIKKQILDKLSIAKHDFHFNFDILPPKDNFIYFNYEKERWVSSRKSPIEIVGTEGFSSENEFEIPEEENPKGWDSMNLYDISKTFKNKKFLYCRGIDKENNHDNDLTTYSL